MYVKLLKESTPEGETSMNFSVLEGRLGVEFEDRSFLKQALTHRSYLNEHRSWPLGHNERLEFLGDAVLELIVTSFLFTKYARQSEGELTRYRAALVNTARLSQKARALGMNDFLLLSRGEVRNTGSSREFILGNALEAVVGALYLDQGYGAVQRFVTTHLLADAEEAIAQCEALDPKSKLQKTAQNRRKITPTYEVLEETGPDHDKQFVVGVYFGSELIATGYGKAKRRAEEQAARTALRIKGW